MKLTTRALIVKLLHCDMDAEISIDADVMSELEAEEGVEILEVRMHELPLSKFTIIKLGKLS